MNIKYLILLLLVNVAAFTPDVFAQSATISPYSRFGPGELVFNGYSHQQGMGGTGIADASSGRLNFYNPATYGYDSIMVFEFGLNAQLTWLQQGDIKAKKNNADLGHLSLGLPLKKNRWGLSFGILPYSSAGYDIRSASVLDSNGTYETVFQGSGGYNRYFLGSGVRIGKNLSVGVNASYLYGTVNRTNRFLFSNIQFFSTRYEESVTLKDIYLELGLHWLQPLRNDNSLAIGLSGAPSQNIDALRSVTWTNYLVSATGVESVRDTVQFLNRQKGTVVLPANAGLGLMYNHADKWSLGFDVWMQDWSNYESFGKNDSLANSFRTSVGGRWTANARSNRFAERIQLRGGLYYNRTFLELKNTALDEKGISIGAGLPFRRSYASMFNFSISAGQRGTLDNNLVREQYLRLQFGVTLNEDWFRPNRYE